MLLNIIVIVLRELLEASILIAVLLSSCRHQAIPLRWLPVALLLGSLGAGIYGWQLHNISQWFDYTGQELLNAGMQFFLYGTICLLVMLQWARTPRHKTMATLMALMVITAMVREGSEIYLFLSGFLLNDQVWLQTITSLFISLGIGLSAGALTYYSLTSLPERLAGPACSVALTLIGAGMVLQATQLLIQADWIAATEPLWDSRWLLNEASIAGQLAYAIFGYEATPSLTEVLVYALAVGTIALTALLVSGRLKQTAGAST